MSDRERLQQLVEFRFGRHHAVQPLVQDILDAGFTITPVQSPVVPSLDRKLLTTMIGATILANQPELREQGGRYELDFEKTVPAIVESILAHGYREPVEGVRPWAEVGRIAQAKFDELAHKGWDWRSFYNGFLEGTAAERNKENPLAGPVGEGPAQADLHGATGPTVLGDGQEPRGSDLLEVSVEDQVRLYRASGGSVEGADKLRAKLTATPPPSNNVREAVEECGWTRDEWSESWSAGCGAEWIFPDGGPAENGMKFCPSCGKPVSLAALYDKGGV